LIGKTLYHMSNDMSMDEMIEVLARYRYNAKHDADRIKALESELSRLRASSFVTAVPSDEYEKVKAENARLKAEVERLKAVSEAWKKRRLDKVEAECINWADVEKENARLKAQVERLTKAGDAMIDEWWLQLSCPQRMKASWLKEQAIVDWNAAKEGKQS